jgi:hypothetical protein
MTVYGEKFLKAFEVPHGGFTTIEEVSDALKMKYRTAARWASEAVRNGDLIDGGQPSSGKKRPKLYRRAGNARPFDMSQKTDVSTHFNEDPELRIEAQPAEQLGLLARLHRLERDLASHREVVTGKLDDLIRLLS